MKYHAICENHLYAKAYAKGRKAAAKTLAVYVLRDYHAYRLMKENPQKKYINRIGLTVSKKIGHAVTRNRVKRILREAYRLTDRECEIKKGMLVVLVARDACVKAKMQDVKSDLYKCLCALGMIA